jgi:probable F420-dependent oxidoreductase
MRFGVALGRLNPHFWPAVSVAADELSFDFVSLPEHLVLPVSISGSPTGDGHPPIDSSLPVFDVWVYIGYLAGLTSHIRFGTYVYNLGLRHPFVTARAVATAEILSRGRVDVGLGASWLAEEWAAVGLDFRTRGPRFDEALHICQRLWTEDVIEHHGEFFDFQPVRFEPKPVQRPVPLVVGGDALVTVRRAARVGAGWVPLQTPTAELPQAISRFKREWIEAGRDPGQLRVIRALHHARTSDIEQLERIGISDLVVAPWQRSPDATAALQEFAEAHIRK